VGFAAISREITEERIEVAYPLVYPRRGDARWLGVMVVGGKKGYQLSIVRNGPRGKPHPTPSRVMDGFEVHIQFLDHLKRLSA
jgi:hypothetical protein